MINDARSPNDVGTDTYLHRMLEGINCAYYPIDACPGLVLIRALLPIRTGEELLTHYGLAAWKAEPLNSRVLIRP